MNIRDFFSIDEPFTQKFCKEGNSLWNALINLKEFFQNEPLGNIQIEIPQSVHIDDVTILSIGKNTVIEPGVYIQGPCIIGENVRIRHGAYIREHVVIGDGCVIGHNTEVKHSILFPGVKAAHFAYIGDSILGERVNLGAGVKCANFRLDQKEIFVRYQEKKIASGLNKLGAIIGNDVQIGCNTVLNPGTLIGKMSVLRPLICARGYFPPESNVTK